MRFFSYNKSDCLNLRADPSLPARGTVLEARMDKGLGLVVTVLVSEGTLKVGDLVLAGPSWGKVRRLLSTEGRGAKNTPVQIAGAGPSIPVQVD